MLRSRIQQGRIQPCMHPPMPVHPTHTSKLSSETLALTKKVHITNAILLRRRHPMGIEQGTPHHCPNIEGKAIEQKGQLIKET